MSYENRLHQIPTQFTQEFFQTCHQIVSQAEEYKLSWEGETWEVS